MCCFGDWAAVCGQMGPRPHGNPAWSWGSFWFVHRSTQNMVLTLIHAHSHSWIFRLELFGKSRGFPVNPQQVKLLFKLGIPAQMVGAHRTAGA